MAAKRNMISRESSKCAFPGCLQSTRTGFAAGSLPNEPNMGIAGEASAARHNADIWDNENGFRNQADGCFD